MPASDRTPSQTRLPDSSPASFGSSCRRDGEAERQAGTDFRQRMIIDATAAYADIDRQIVTNLPDCPEQLQILKGSGLARPWNRGTPVDDLRPISVP